MDTIMETKPFAESELVGRAVNVGGSHDPAGVFICSGGTGCYPSSQGGQVYGRYIASGRETYVRRDSLIGFASDGEVGIARNWANQPVWVRNLEEARKIRLDVNAKVGEVARDRSSNASKDRMRAVLLDTKCSVDDLLALFEESSSAVRQPELEGVNGYQAE